VDPAPEWTDLFDRNTGWTGADGIYSIPLTGVDVPGGAAQSYTLFVFSDTFIGDVDPGGKRLSGTVMVNNTLAVLKGDKPDPNMIRFFHGGDANDPKAVFVPETPATQPGDWYWLGDGIAIGSRAHLFTLRMMTGGGGVFNFAVAGVTLITIPLDSAKPLADAVQVDAPLFHVPSDGRGEIIYGGAVMASTQQAGAPVPDGFIYVYGTQNDPLNKKLVAARVRPQDFASFGQWRFWDGIGWSPDIDASAALTSRISSEFSVTPMPDGRFILVFQLDTLSREVAFRIGKSPIGPWGAVHEIYTSPEPGFDPDIYTYNAKAHPHLSRPGELLISYNVNTFDFWDHFAWADIYRPRFVRLRLVD